MLDDEELWGLEVDPAPRRLKHRDTPELHLKDIARQNAWVEGLRSLGGEAVEHGAIEVLDGEIVPPGALSRATPTGGRVYEATGNEGASLELQYRHAALVVWRRNRATLRMLARCGGRLALAVELAQRTAAERGRDSMEGGIEDVLSLWREALASDGGGPEPDTHRIILDKLQGAGSGPVDGVQGSRLRWRYVEGVAAVDLDAEAAPTLVAWINTALDAGERMDAWTRALRPAFSFSGRFFRHAQSGAPALLRALTEHPRTLALAGDLLAGQPEPPTTVAGVLREADRLEEAVARDAWIRRRRARMTMDA